MVNEGRAGQDPRLRPGQVGTGKKKRGGEELASGFRRRPEHRPGRRARDGGLHVAEQAAGAGRWTSAPTSSPSARSSTRWRRENARFQKGTAVDTMSAILHEEPKPLAGRSDPRLRLRCAGSSTGAWPRTRKRDTPRRGDLARDLATVRDHLSEASSRRAGRRLSRCAAPALSLLVADCSLSAAVLAVLRRRRHRSGRRDPSTGQPTSSSSRSRAAASSTARFAPDGDTIVYGAGVGGQSDALFSTRPDAPRVPCPRTSRRRTSSPISVLGRARDLAAASLTPQRWARWPRCPRVGGAPRELLDKRDWGRGLGSGWA